MSRHKLPTMTVTQLIEVLTQLQPEHGNKEIKAWLPGSTISFEGVALFSPKHNAVIIPSNLDYGSALGDWSWAG